MMFRTRTAAFGLALATVFVLSGCASEPTAVPTTTTTTAPAPTSSMPAPSATPTSTPSPSAPDIDTQDPSTWLVTQAGIGPLEWGGPFDAALALMPADSVNDTENCVWTSFWSPADASYQFVIARASDDAPDGPVVTIAAISSPGTTQVTGPRTAEGVGIGSSLDDLTAAYPEAVPVDSPIGDGEGVPRYLQVGDSIFFTYYGGTDVVAGVTVTTAQTPSYEFCG